MDSVEEKSEGNRASLLKEWSQVRGQLREEREAFRAKRRQADADLERLRDETENLRASMERLQRRVERQSSSTASTPIFDPGGHCHRRSPRLAAAAARGGAGPGLPPPQRLLKKTLS